MNHADRPPAGAAFDAVVLAGGRGSRLGGTDKPTLRVAGATLIERAVEAVAAAGALVVVGPHRVLPARSSGRIVATSEDPPGGGPVAAVAAGLAHTDEDIVVVLACDMPLVDATFVAKLVGRLAASEPPVDAALAVDGEGRRQYLAGAYRRTRLLAALAALDSVHEAAMRAVVNGLTVVEVVTDPESTLDADTWDDLERLRRLLEEP